MEPEKLSFDDLVKKVNEDCIASSIWINTNVEEDTPSFIGLPVHFKYIPTVTVKTLTRSYMTEGIYNESPDDEEARLIVKVRAYELAFRLIEALSGKEIHKGEPVEIKLDDLLLSNAKTLFELYQKELDRVQKAHENYRYL